LWVATAKDLQIRLRLCSCRWLIVVTHKLRPAHERELNSISANSGQRLATGNDLALRTPTRFRFIGVAMVLTYLLIALFAILLAALLLFLLTYMG
jgi:hypothetical protein